MAFSAAITEPAREKMIRVEMPTTAIILWHIMPPFDDLISWIIK
jgi:hypothetical protein